LHASICEESQITASAKTTFEGNLEEFCNVVLQNLCCILDFSSQNIVEVFHLHHKVNVRICPNYTAKK